MNNFWEQWLTNLDRVRFVLQALDIVLVLLLSYVVLVIIGERRTLWMVRGLIFLDAVGGDQSVPGATAAGVCAG